MFSYNLQLYFSKQILFGSWEERLFGLHETPVDDTITLLIYKFYIYMTVYLLKYIPYILPKMKQKQAKQEDPKHNG